MFESGDHLREGSEKTTMRTGERSILVKLSYNKYNIFGEDRWSDFKEEMNSLVKTMVRS